MMATSHYATTLMVSSGYNQLMELIIDDGQLMVVDHDGWRMKHDVWLLA